MVSKYLLVLLSIVSPFKITKGVPVKLVGSTLQYAGRVVIKTNGNWTSICDVGWNIKSARVVCRQLGYSEAEAAISGQAFGPAPGQIEMKQFRCKGNEASLMKCAYNNTNCSNTRVGAVLCKPAKNIDTVYILISGVCFLAFISIIILLVTCTTMRLRSLIEKQRKIRSLPPSNREIGVSNFDIEGVDATAETVADTLSDGEPKLGVDDDRKKNHIVSSALSDSELIKPCREGNHHVDDERHLDKQNESRKRRYMPLRRTSRALIHFYTKLLQGNRNHKKRTSVDFIDDYYSTGEIGKVWTEGNIHNITDVDSINSATDEYHEIYPDSQENKGESGEKDGLDYMPMLSLSHMHTNQVAFQTENPEQVEYLDILPPTSPSIENNSKSLGKRDSDYLVPVEMNLPSFPKTAPCSYEEEELPEPPIECETLTTECKADKRGTSNVKSLVWADQECRCRNDLICNKCLNEKTNKKCDEDFEYMPMGDYGAKSNWTDEQEKSNVRRNSKGYAIPEKKSVNNDKKVHGNFTKELNKKLLNPKVVRVPSLPRSVDKRLIPNEADVYDSITKSSGTMEGAQENGGKSRSSSQTGLNVKDNENEVVKKDEKTFSRGIPTRSSNPKENKPNSKTCLSQAGHEIGGKTKSCAVEATSKATQSALFMKSLENIFGTNASRDKTGSEKGSLTDPLREEQKQTEMEHSYESDYEAISPTGDSEYENDGIYSIDDPKPSSDECEYDYVNAKQRKSLHFYEAVSKELDEDDQYEDI